MNVAHFFWFEYAIFNYCVVFLYCIFILTVQSQIFLSLIIFTFLWKDMPRLNIHFLLMHLIFYTLHVLQIKLSPTLVDVQVGNNILDFWL